jgi:hypothetical protein
METSFFVKVTGSITVSIKPSNEDEDEDGGGDANGGGSILEVFLVLYMKSLVNDAIKKYVTTVEEDEDVVPFHNVVFLLTLMLMIRYLNH